MLRLTLTNCEIASRTIAVTATDGAVSVTPAGVTLGPMEQGLVVLTLELPASAAAAAPRRRSSGSRAARSTTSAGASSPPARVTCCTADVDVEDCPDLVHHWYDHFYCPRPCPEKR